MTTPRVFAGRAYDRVMARLFALGGGEAFVHYQAMWHAKRARGYLPTRAMYEARHGVARGATIYRRDADRLEAERRRAMGAAMAAAELFLSSLRHTAP